MVALTNISTQLVQNLSIEHDTEPVLHAFQPRFKPRNDLF
jgi:hypothetical protein